MNIRRIQNENTLSQIKENMTDEIGLYGEDFDPFNHLQSLNNLETAFENDKQTLIIITPDLASGLQTNFKNILNNKINKNLKEIKELIDKLAL